MDKLLVNSRLTRRSLLQRTSIGAALAATNLSLPFKAVANEKKRHPHQQKICRKKWFGVLAQ